MHLPAVFRFASGFFLLLASLNPCSAQSCPSWEPARVFGQVDLSQVNYNQVVPDRVFHPAGVLIDRMPEPLPSRLYVWDSGNHRVLGFEAIGTCVGGETPGVACTENSICGSGSCTGDLRRPATVVLGQPSAYGQGACNGNSTVETAAGPGTLCAIPFPYQISPLEGPRGNSLAVDAAHNLYVVDLFNNRVLRFDDPFRFGSTADRVWGQLNFRSRDCNQGLGAPDASTLCTGDIRNFYPNYYFSGGVDVTADGSILWVADLGNHRVLRIPTAGPNADLVLGQADFTTVEAACTPPYPLDRFCKPNAVRYDQNHDRLFVLDGDAEYARILVFDHPSSNGQPASAVLDPPSGSHFFWSRGLTLDPFETNAFWMCDTDQSRLLQYVDDQPTRVLSKGDFLAAGCIGGLVGDGPIYPQVCNPHGSLGIDRDGAIYSGDLQEQHLERFPGPQPLPRPDGVAHSPDALLLDDGSFQGNSIGASGLANPGDVLLVGSQLVIADRQRILFWNEYATGSLPAGPASGVLAQPGFEGWTSYDITHGYDFSALAHDSTRNLLYAVHGPYITAWSTSGGLQSQSAPAFQIQSPLPLRGGGTTPFHSRGIAVSPVTDSAWVSDHEGNRILRLINISQSTRKVDAIVGQPSLDQGECNRGLGRFSPLPTGFCRPTQVTTDQSGNLYIVDSDWEGNGNQRAVQYLANSLPAIPSPRLYWTAGGPTPARVFAKDSFTAVDCDSDIVQKPCTPRFLCFEPGTNRMVMTVDGYGNPLDSRAFLYDDPLPSGVLAPQPSGRIPLRFNQAAGCSFDTAGRLAILDHTWNRALLITDPPGSGENSDGDRQADSCDCAPSSGEDWSLPGEVTRLVFDDRRTLAWTPPALGGGTTLTYEVYRSLYGGGAVPVFTCLAWNIPPTFLDEPAAPPAGGAFLYLVRAENGCGAGSVGKSEGAPPRTVPDCP